MTKHNDKKSAKIFDKLKLKQNNSGTELTA